VITRQEPPWHPSPFVQAGLQNTPLPLAAAGADPGSPSEPVPRQGAGPHFTIGATGRISVAPPSEPNAAGNDIGRVRQFLPLVRRAADDLAAALNPNQFTALTRNLADYRSVIARDASEIPWGLVFGLGVRLANAADAAQRQIDDRVLPALEDPAQEALQSLNVLHGSLILATAEGRELQEQADRLQMTREQQAVFRAAAAAIAAGLHSAAEVIEPEADKIVTDAVEVIGEGRHPERGFAFGIATFTHVTIVLVSAATVVAIGAAIGGPMGAAAGSGATWFGLKGLEKSRIFTAATAAIGQNFDRLHELDGARLRQLLIQLVPFRRFVTDNQEPLRRIATNTRQMRWMLPYIDFIARQTETKPVAPPSGDLGADDRPRVQQPHGHDIEMKLSFDANDPECVKQVPVYVLGRSWLATSVRVRVQVNSSVMLQKVMGYLTKVEKLLADEQWQESAAPDTPLIWVGDTSVVDIPPSSTKYLNILHINAPDNKIGAWKTQLPSLLEDFLSEEGTYRFTVSVLAEGVTRWTRILVNWQGEWDKLQVFSAP